MRSKTLYTVIVADDEDELREAVCSMILWEEYGFKLVGSASNGLDALQLVEKLEPDLLLTDIRMPFISGIELARQVREACEKMGVPIVEVDTMKHLGEACKVAVKTASAGIRK